MWLHHCIRFLRTLRPDVPPISQNGEVIHGPVKNRVRANGCLVRHLVCELPGWLQPVSWELPSAHVFEGMRAVLFDGVFHFDLFAAAVALNVLYFALATGFFLYMFHVARQRGLLLQQGE